MAFNTPIFLLLFFPLSLGLFYLLRLGSKPVGKLYLIVISLFFYAWGEARFFWLLPGLLLLNYLGLYLCSKLKPGPAKGLRFFLIVLDLAALIWGKYGLDHLPLGLSFFVFRLISAVVDQAGIEAPLSFLDYSLYIVFFPQLISGPIARYDSFTSALRTWKPQFSDVAPGLRRFIPGLFMKVLIADPLAQARLDLLNYQARGVAEAWLIVLIYSLYLYLDFASYSHMAIGLSRMYGLPAPENFNLPYLARNITDFWRRWHMSLSSFFRDYVYIPLGGNRKGKGRQVLNILIVWALTGIWHGSTLNFLLWGLYYGILLLLEKFFLAKALNKLPVFLQRLLTFFLVSMGWVLFAFPKKTELFDFVAGLFGSAGAGGPYALYTLLNYGLVILLGLLISFGIGKKLQENYRKSKLSQKKPVQAVHLLLTAGLLVLCMAYIIDQSFASFLYFQF
jgi:alginate O-acetyltransferase complex protein AlgI